MKESDLFERLLVEFDKWYLTDEHKLNIGFYNDILTKENIETFTNKELVDFFYNFISEGGKVQSGGDRSKNRFKIAVESNMQSFRLFVLEPFNENFALSDWFNRIESYKHFGIGIATIYLNRIDKERYPIMNNKTLKALRKLGHNISLTENFTNYNKVNKIQNELIISYPILTDFYVADAFNHYIIAVENGKELMIEYSSIKDFGNLMEQNEIVNDEENSNEHIDKQALYQKIREFEKHNSEFEIINGKRYRRDNYIMAKIKKYRDFKCQFCSTTIIKEKGGYYIEACHIKAKADGGKDSIDNILILCPNCHKRFDYAKRENEKFVDNIYLVTLNGKQYKAELK